MNAAPWQWDIAFSRVVMDDPHLVLISITLEDGSYEPHPRALAALFLAFAPPYQANALANFSFLEQPVS